MFFKAMFLTTLTSTFTESQSLLHMRIALVHDWLTGMRGGEKCLEVLCELFPEAPIYTLLHVRGSVSPTIESHEIRTSFIQHLPFLESTYRSYLPLFPTAIESLDLSAFDLVISGSHCVAKGARVGHNALHVCYCHTPMRYVYEMYDEYFGKGRAGFLTRQAMRYFAPRLRAWDQCTADRVHHYIANSENVRKRIHRIYNRDAEVVYPPVDTGRFRPTSEHGDYYLVVSALVPYKRVDLAIEVFNRSGKRLIVVGKGPDTDRLQAMAKPNVKFGGWKNEEELSRLYGECKMLIFPGVEDFGIVHLEAMACGKPVVAFARGGALETVVEGKTGVFFHEQTVTALEQAIATCDTLRFDPDAVRKHAMRFSRATFEQRFRSALEDQVKQRLHTSL